jgi:AraC-like DNA-binding protein
LAEEGDPSNTSRDLFISLLRLGRRHLLEDDPAKAHPRAKLTWRRVQQFLEENHAQPVTRHSAAASLGLHPNYLSTLARHVAGKSFREVLETIRMQHAQRLLRTTDLKLRRISSLCGYTDSANFIKAFRRIVGVTPGRFREPGAEPNGGKNEA